MECMIRVAVIDDEDAVCSRLEKYIHECSTAMHIAVEVDIFTSGENFISHLNANDCYNLIFLDIELKQCSGIDVSEHIRSVLHNESVQIAYVSGKNGYDRQLFAFRPFHFVDKPFDRSKIAAVLEKYLRIYGTKSDIFHYKVGHDVYWVKLSDVLFFRSLDRKVMIRTITGTDEFYGSLEKISVQLQGQGFLFPHKSYIVNYRFVKSFQFDTIQMINNEEIPIAKTKRRELAKAQILLESGGE